MEYSELTIRLVILFIPGIIATYIYEICQNKNDLSNRDFIFNVVLCAVVVYSLTYVFFSIIGGKPSFFEVLFDSSVQINVNEIIIASILSIFIGFIEGFVVVKIIRINTKKVEKNKKVRLSVWEDLFNESSSVEDHIKLILKPQNLIYEGYVKEYAVSMQDRKEVCLRDVTKYNLETGEEMERDICEVYVRIQSDEDVIVEKLNSNK